MMTSAGARRHAVLALILGALIFGTVAAQAQGYTFVTKWGTLGSGNGQFYYPNALAIDTSGSVYVADTNNHRIQKLAPQ